MIADTRTVDASRSRMRLQLLNDSGSESTIRPHGVWTALFSPDPEPNKLDRNTPDAESAILRRNIP